jgi:hypothetical protein
VSIAAGNVTLYATLTGLFQRPYRSSCELSETGERGMSRYGRAGRDLCDVLFTSGRSLMGRVCGWGKGPGFLLRFTLDCSFESLEW